MNNITIFDRWMIAEDYESNPTDIEIINIEKNFDFTDGNYGPHFSRHKKLREFCVLDNNESNFFVSQGCLYMRLSNTRTNIESVSGDLLDDIYEGSILVCCPQSNSIKDIILPSDCVAIAASAFDGCTLNSLTLPDSLLCGGLACFSNLNLRILKVPEKAVQIGIDHNSVNTDVVILSNRESKCSEDIEKFWRMAINEETWENGDTEWWNKMLYGTDFLYSVEHTIDFNPF